MTEEIQKPEEEGFAGYPWQGYGILVPEKQLLVFLHEKFGEVEYADDIIDTETNLKFEQVAGKILIGREFVYMPKSQTMGQFENDVIRDLKLLFGDSGIDIAPKYQILILDLENETLLEWDKQK